MREGLGICGQSFFIRNVWHVDALWGLERLMALQVKSKTVYIYIYLFICNELCGMPCCRHPFACENAFLRIDCAGTPGLRSRVEAKYLLV